MFGHAAWSETPWSTAPSGTFVGPPVEPPIPPPAGKGSGGGVRRPIHRHYFVREDEEEPAPEVVAESIRKLPRVAALAKPKPAPAIDLQALYDEEAEILLLLH